MGRDCEPSWFVGLYALPVPFLIGDGVIGVFESALLELDVSDYHLICVNAPFDHAVDPRDLHHFHAQITELMRCKERSVRPSESHPGDARLRLQLRDKDELAFVCFSRLKDILKK